MKIIAIVLAGGSGSRMKSDIPKQYMMINNMQVLSYSIKAFEESCVDEIILVTKASDIDYCREYIVRKNGFKKVACITEGGSERYDSVMNGLKQAYNRYKNYSDTYVLIHDGARPCITSELIKACVEDVIKYKACVAAVPVKDTIKIADKDGYAAETPDRNSLWQIQTPQCFELELVKTAYSKMFADSARGTITDDAMVVEKYTDTRVKLTYSSYKNIKITTPEDILIAQQFIDS